MSYKVKLDKKLTKVKKRSRKTEMLTKISLGRNIETAFETAVTLLIRRNNKKCLCPKP